MNKPDVYDEALASTLDAWKNDEIEKYDKALRAAIKNKLPAHQQTVGVFRAINEAKVEEKEDDGL